MSSVPGLGFYLSGKFREKRDWMTKYGPFSSWCRTDGLPCCGHSAAQFSFIIIFVEETGNASERGYAWKIIDLNGD